MVIRGRTAIPLREITLRASRSSGPGGQHANVTASRVEASFDVDASEALSPTQKARIIERLGPVVSAVAQDERSQARNRELALERLRGRLASRARRPAAAPRNPPERRCRRPWPRRQAAALGAQGAAPPAGRTST